MNRLAITKFEKAQNPKSAKNVLASSCHLMENIFTKLKLQMKFRRFWTSPTLQS